MFLLPPWNLLPPRRLKNHLDRCVKHRFHILQQNPKQSHHKDSDIFTKTFLLESFLVQGTYLLSLGTALNISSCTNLLPQFLSLFPQVISLRKLLEIHFKTEPTREDYTYIYLRRGNDIGVIREVSLIIPKILRTPRHNVLAKRNSKQSPKKKT